MSEPVRLLLVRHGRTAWNASGRYMGQLDEPLDEVGLGQAEAVARRLGHERPAAVITSDLRRASQTAAAIHRAIGESLRREAAGEAPLPRPASPAPGRLPGPAGGQSPATKVDTSFASYAIHGQAAGVDKSASILVHQPAGPGTPPGGPPLLYEQRLREMNFGAWQGKTYAELQTEDPLRLAAWEADFESHSPPGGETLLDFADRVGQAYAAIVAAYPGQSVIVVAHGGPLQMLLTQALGLPPARFWQFGLSNTGWSELNIYPAGAILNRMNDTAHLETGTGKG